MKIVGQVMDRARLHAQLGWWLTGAWITLVLLSATATHATDIDFGTPGKAGTVILDLIGNYGDSTSSRCTVVVPIAAGKTAEEKADACMQIETAQAYWARRKQTMV